MTALSDNRATDSKSLGPVQSYPVAASTTIYAGSLVMINASGYAVPASATAGNKGCIGVAQAKADNSSGSAGAIDVKCQEGIFKFAASTLTQADVGSLVFAEDDQTVDQIKGDSQPLAGKLLEYVDASNGWIAVGPAYQDLGSGGGADGPGMPVFLAAANYSSTGQYLAMDIDTTADQIVKETGDGAVAIGILQNAPASGASAFVAVGGNATFMAGTGGVSAGDELEVESTTGKFITATAGSYVVAKAKEAVAADAVGLCWLFPSPYLKSVDGVALAAAKIWVGNASGAAAAVSVSGDVTISNAGAVTIAANAVEESMLLDADGTSGLYPARIALAHYDFATDGGAAGAITLTDAVTIPDNAVCNILNYDVITTCTTAGADAGTIKFNLVTDGDLSTAIAVSDGTNPWDAGAHLGSVITPVIAKTTGARLVQVTAAGQNITAGKFVGCIEYWVSQ